MSGQSMTESLWAPMSSALIGLGVVVATCPEELNEILMMVALSPIGSLSSPKSHGNSKD